MKNLRQTILIIAVLTLLIPNTFAITYHGRDPFFEPLEIAERHDNTFFYLDAFYQQGIPITGDFSKARLHSIAQDMEIYYSNTYEEKQYWQEYQQVLYFIPLENR